MQIIIGINIVKYKWNRAPARTDETLLTTSVLPFLLCFFAPYCETILTKVHNSFEIQSLNQLSLCCLNNLDGILIVGQSAFVDHFPSASNFDSTIIDSSIGTRCEIRFLNRTQFSKMMMIFTFWYYNRFGRDVRLSTLESVTSKTRWSADRLMAERF